MEMKKRSFGEVIGGLALSTLPLIGFMAVQVIVTIVLMLVFLLNGDPSTLANRVQEVATNQDFLMKTIVYTNIATLICAIPVYVFALKEHKLANPAKIFSWYSPLVIILLFIGLEMVTSAALVFAYEVPFLTDIMEGYSQMIENSGLAEMTVLSTIATLLLAPITEEIVFRGMTLKIARRITRKFWIANIIQALLFGIAHGNLVQGTYAFILGMVLGFVYKKYNSLLASILAHMAFNFAGTYVVSWISNASGSKETLALILEFAVGVVAIIAGLVLVLKVDKKTPANTQTFNEKYADEWRLMLQKKLAEQERYNQYIQQACMQQVQQMQQTPQMQQAPQVQQPEQVQQELPEVSDTPVEAGANDVATDAMPSTNDNKETL